jgi:hypothetical protein
VAGGGNWERNGGHCTRYLTGGGTNFGGVAELDWAQGWAHHLFELGPHHFNLKSIL